MDINEIKEKINRLAGSGRSRAQIAGIIQDWPISQEIIEEVHLYIHQVRYPVKKYQRRLEIKI